MLQELQAVIAQVLEDNLVSEGDDLDSPLSYTIAREALDFLRGEGWVEHNPDGWERDED